MKRFSASGALTLLLTVGSIAVAGALGVDPRKTIEGGEFSPLYGVSSELERLKVQGFKLDIYPVTNAQYHAFLVNHPEWKVENSNQLLSDEKYLKHWCSAQGGKKPCALDEKHPVTNISWFAASDYCAAQGGRLPTVLEWEYVAAASDLQKDASRDPEFVQRLLSWYSQPAGITKLQEVGQQRPNIWGIHDLHGLVWEWTEDFNSVFVAGDNRRDDDKLNNLFCGNGAASASDRANYAAFMRYALRNSLRGDYTMENLGFRCAYDLKKG